MHELPALACPLGAHAHSTNSQRATTRLKIDNVRLQFTMIGSEGRIEIATFRLLIKSVTRGHLDLIFATEKPSAVAA